MRSLPPPASASGCSRSAPRTCAGLDQRPARPAASFIRLHLIHRELADFAAVAAVVATVLAESYIVVGSAEDAEFFALALVFRQGARGAVVFEHNPSLVPTLSCTIAQLAICHQGFPQRRTRAGHTRGSSPSGSIW